MLHTEKEYIENRHIMGQEMFNYMAAYSPAFGMMGTVMGLVVMMSGFGEQMFQVLKKARQINSQDY